MLNSLSRNRTLPQIAPRCGCVDPLPGRLPFQGYESPCSGRHYCLRGMDYCTTGEPSRERRLRPLCSEEPTVRFAGIRPLLPGSTHKRALPPRVPHSASFWLCCFHARPPSPGHKPTAKAENQREGYPKSSILSLPSVLKVNLISVCTLEILQNSLRGFQSLHISRNLFHIHGPWPVLVPWDWRQRF